MVLFTLGIFLFVFIHVLGSLSNASSIVFIADHGSRETLAIVSAICVPPTRTLFVGEGRILSTLMLNCQFLPWFLSLTLFLTYF